MAGMATPTDRRQTKPAILHILCLKLLNYLNMSILSFISPYNINLKRSLSGRKSLYLLCLQGHADAEATSKAFTGIDECDTESKLKTSDPLTRAFEEEQQK